MPVIDETDRNSFHDFRCWRVGDAIWQLGRFPRIMGIVNVTPDSFSDGNKHFTPRQAVDHALALIEDGADIIDVGGESTRPGAIAVSREEELRRVLPVIEGIRAVTDIPISIDTTKARVARRAIEAGAQIVNDISGLTFDSGMVDVCAELDASVICMHIQGTPQTMQDDPRYDDVVAEICQVFKTRSSELTQRGIQEDRIVFDPGIGFGKTAAHNLKILSNIAAFRSFGRPVLVGHSRKRFLKKLLGRPVEERVHGTMGVAVALAQQHVDILRVHDVRATRDTLLAWDAIVRDDATGSNRVN